MDSFPCIWHSFLPHKVTKNQGGNEGSLVSRVTEFLCREVQLDHPYVSIGKPSDTNMRSLIQGIELGLDFLQFSLCSFYHTGVFLIWCLPERNSDFISEDF